MSPRPSNITLVGAGLVGSLLAIYLGKRGYSVTVFERRPDMRKGPVDAGRSINLALSTRGIRALNEVGLDHVIRQTALPMKGRLMHDTHGKLSFLPYGTSGQYINSISRSGLNITLIDAAEKAGVKFFFNHRCQDINLEKTEITFQTPKGTVHHGAGMLIGTDGAFSAVRGAMQITERFQYSQHYIEHGYKELHIPAGPKGEFLMEKEALHIWPRESFMLIALPNPDASFTCTLFFPFDGKISFATIKSDAEILSFFQSVFPDVIPLMPSLIHDFKSNPTSSLVTINCFPWVKNRTLILGDAAHGIVPFFGQGMNAGFEDCRVLNDLLDQHKDNWDLVLPDFQALRKPDADAIATLAMDNFVEMRDLVGDPKFLLRKKIEAKLHERYPEKWIPLYSMVTFNDSLRYSEALKIGRKQNEIMEKVMARPSIETAWTSLDLGGIVDQLATN